MLDAAFDDDKGGDEEEAEDEDDGDVKGRPAHDGALTTTRARLRVMAMDTKTHVTARKTSTRAPTPMALPR
jgi:hypothetical protein